MKTGYYKRPKPPLEILRGFSLDTPERQGDHVPVLANVTIVSGQVCFRKYDGTGDKFDLDLGCVRGAVPYLAVEDSNAPNYIGSNGLHVISCAEPRLVQTAFFVSGTYKPGDPLTFVLNGVSGAGNVRKATSNSDIIIGYVERPRRPQLAVPASPNDYELGTRDLVAEGELDGVENGNVLVWTTSWTGATLFASTSGA